MAKSSQLSLLKEPRKHTKKWWVVKHSTYGGALNYRKLERPFDSKKLTHIVFKARTTQGTSFRKRETTIVKIMSQAAQKYGINIKSYSVQKDHVHVLTYTIHRQALTNFLRFFSAEVGRLYSKLFRSWGVHKTQNLWQARPFTRLVSFKKRDLETVRNYIRKNTFEALGFVEYHRSPSRLNIFLSKSLTEIF